MCGRITTYGLFIDRHLGRVGMTEREVRESGREALIGSMMMARVGRARERSETQGFMKILVDAKTNKILGAAILAIGDEVVHSLLNIMYADAPYTVIQCATHIHPTVTELIPTLLGDLRPLAWGAKPVCPDYCTRLLYQLGHDLAEIKDFKGLKSGGVPYGTRTRVAAVKGRCPRPLDEGDADRGVAVRRNIAGDRRSSTT